MSHIFDNCKSLTIIPNISKWNFQNVEDISWMFYNCESLISLTYINFLTKLNIKRMDNIFKDSSFSQKISSFLSDKEYLESISSNNDNNLSSNIIFEDYSTNIFYNEIDDTNYDNFYS